MGHSTNEISLAIIQQMQCRALGVPSSSATRERTFHNPSLVIGLGVGLQCSPTGSASGGKVPIDQAFVSTYIVDVGSGKFLSEASRAAESILTAHASWPGDRFHIGWPNTKKKKIAESRLGANGTISDPGRSSGAMGVTDEAEGGVGSAGEEERERATAASQDLRFPSAGRRRVLKPGAPKAANATSKRGRPVHEGASWYMTFSCAMMTDGCPVTGILMQLATEDDKLHVRFSSDCRHQPGAESKGQLRGALRDNLVESIMAGGGGGGHSVSVIHRGALASRPVEQQLCQDVSAAGANPHVVSQAVHQARAAESKFDCEQIESARKRMLSSSSADLAATPDEDRKDRLWGGDIPFLTQLSDATFMLLRMMDMQLWRWVALCMRGGGRGGGGLYMDTTEGQAS